MDIPAEMATAQDNDPHVTEIDWLGKPPIPNEPEYPDGLGSTVGPRYPFATARKFQKSAQAAQTDISRLRSV